MINLFANKHRRKSWKNLFRHGWKCGHQEWTLWCPVSFFNLPNESSFEERETSSGCITWREMTANGFEVDGNFSFHCTCRTPFSKADLHAYLQMKYVTQEINSPIINASFKTNTPKANYLLQGLLSHCIDIQFCPYLEKGHHWKVVDVCLQTCMQSAPGCRFLFRCGH